MRRRMGRGGDVYLGRTGLERLHGPAEHLELALGERGAGCGGRSAGVVVRHSDDGVMWDVMRCKNVVMCEYVQRRCQKMRGEEDAK
jgi:hypothetical protein